MAPFRIRNTIEEFTVPNVARVVQKPLEARAFSSAPSSFASFSSDCTTDTVHIPAELTVTVSQ